MKILHVEDSDVDAYLFDDAVCSLTHDILRRVSTGAEAVKLLSEDTFSLIVLDLKLPVLNGFDVLRAIRAKDHQTPVVVYTSSSSFVDYEMATELGASAYVVKPVRVQDLEAFVLALHSFWVHHGRG